MRSQLDILLYCDREQMRDQLWGTIAWHFQTVFHPADTPAELSHSIRDIHPDLLLIDSHTARKQGLSAEAFEQASQYCDFCILMGELPSGLLPSDVPTFQLSKNPDQQEIIHSIENAAERLGYIIDEGKIQERLVRRRLTVRLIVEPDQVEWVGRTTGVNLNGLGARIRMLNGASPAEEQLIDRSCVVHFDDSDLSLTPARGHVKRVEESWEPTFQLFVAVEFEPDVGFTADEQSRQTIKHLIRQQEDKSIATPGMENWF